VSQENVERLRHGIEAFNRGDRTAFLALCDPEVENIPPREWPESEPIRGREAVWDFYIETTSLWDKRSFAYTEIMEVGDDKIVAACDRRCRVKPAACQSRWPSGRWSHFARERSLASSSIPTAPPHSKPWAGLEDSESLSERRNELDAALTALAK
jgi:ketosteroid isomerase-like protein